MSDETQLHPFVILEASCEHIGAMWVALGVTEQPKEKAKRGTVEYHIEAAEEYGQRLWNELKTLLPEEYARTEMRSSR